MSNSWWAAYLPNKKVPKLDFSICRWCESRLWKKAHMIYICLLEMRWEFLNKECIVLLFISGSFCVCEKNTMYWYVCQVLLSTSDLGVFWTLLGIWRYLQRLQFECNHSRGVSKWIGLNYMLREWLGNRGPFPCRRLRIRISVFIMIRSCMPLFRLFSLNFKWAIMMSPSLPCHFVLIKSLRYDW